MAFEFGNVANEFELQEKVHAFLLSNGWSLVSQINDFDAVYFSNGIDGYKDIYIRVRAGLAEIQGSGHHGGKQYDLSSGDGYTGFLNFFTYQYFPQNGDGYDGYGEAGKFGPRLCWLRGSSGGNGVYVQNFSGQSETNRKWTYLGGSTAGIYTGDSAGALNNTMGVYDGKLNYCQQSGVGSVGYFIKYNLSTRTARYFTELGIVNGSYDAMCYYMDKKTRKEFVFWIGYESEGSTIGYPGQLRRLDLSTELSETGFTGPSSVWSLINSTYGFVNSNMIWDGANHLYMLRGFASTTATAEWAKFHIPTNTWTLLTNLPYTAQHNNKLLWVDKNTSGFTNHRIYTILYTGTVRTTYYINIDENSGMPIGVWTSCGNLPSEYGSGMSDKHLFFHNGTRFFAHGGASTSARDLYFADMADGNLVWWKVDNNYFPATVVTPGDAFVMDGYVSRVHTSLRDRTKYWLFGSKDHLCVATGYSPTPSLGGLSITPSDYSYCYAGAIKQLKDTPIATCSESLLPGSNIEIFLNNIKGEFIIGDYAYISDVTGSNGGVEDAYGWVEGIPKKFCPTERVTITDVNPGVSITVASLTNSYSVGSKIGIDPQPIGITIGNGWDRIQMLNSINTIDASGSRDFSENTALLESVSDTIISASGKDARHERYKLWPIHILHGGIESNFSGEEVRGYLHGVFAVSNSASNENVISMNGHSYIVFTFPTNKTYKFAIGPME